MKRKIYDRVYSALRDYPELRNSDKLLQIHLWENEGFYLSETQKQQFLKATSSESIRRRRQQVQADGYFPASKETQEKRKELEGEMKAEIVEPHIAKRQLSWIK